MKTFHVHLTRDFDQLLSARERELCVLLEAHEKRFAAAVDTHDVTDFKALAGEESLAAVDEAQAEQAAIELEQVLAARRRLHDNSYGRCLECGKALDLRRLTVLPATAFCAACQQLHETHPALPTAH